MLVTLAENDNDPLLKPHTKATAAVFKGLQAGIMSLMSHNLVTKSIAYD